MGKLEIREAQVEDAERLAEIYSYYLADTAVSFEYAVPTASEFRRRIEHTKQKYPYLVCLDDGRLIGYVYAGEYSSREAYAWTVTTSIYVDRNCRRQGAGALLYRELEQRLKKQGIVNLLAGVAYCDAEDEYLTHDSYKFHLKEGYTEVARMRTVGKKFDRWYDLVWLQKKI
ncbi:MAG: N-acetyltransferase [Treponema sp.]|nr:N-acetyltransferase [Treponema sp.]